MTSEEKYLESRIGKKNSFRVPEGYFENLTAQVIQHLPEQAGAKVVEMRPTIFEKLRPVLYVAACLAIAVFSLAIYLDRVEDVSEQQVVVENTVSGDQYFEEVADYAMIDNYEIYACLTNE